MDKKTLIYEAGLNVISTNGFFNTKVQDIVNYAGISVGSFYNYFKDKNDLLFFIFEYRVSKLNTAIKNINKLQLNPLEKIDKYIDFLIEHKEQNPFLETVIRENFWYFHKLLTTHDNSKYSEINVELEDNFCNIFGQAQGLGLIKTTDPQAAYNIINSIIFNYQGLPSNLNSETSKKEIKNFIKLAYYTN